MIDSATSSMKIPDLEKPRYKRFGECKRCGACCLVEDPPCPHLKWDKDGKAVCAIFEESERPLRCILFPGNPPIPFKTCGYYFKDTWNSNKIVKERL